jgi:tetratricopeptide (TPR) repeat protein
MSPIIINAAAEGRLHHDRDFDGALELFHRALELDPVFPPSRMGLAYLYAMQGNTEAALAEVDKLPHNPSTLQILRAHILFRAGRQAEALAIVRQVEARSGEEFVSPAYLAGIWGELGERDKAFAHLRKACDQRDPALLMLKVEPAYDQLRSDPRFKEVLRCVHLD